MQTPASNPLGTNLYPEGFLAIRSGIFDHLNQSRFTANDWMVYTILLRQSDWQSGRWNGNAFRIRAAVGNALTIRQIQHSMRRLVEKGYTKTFHKQGAKGNYFVLIHKYRVCVGNLKGRVLNALRSDSYARPVYEDECERQVISTVGGCERDVTWMSPSPDVDVYQELKNTRSQDEQESNPPTIQEFVGPQTLNGGVEGRVSRSQSKRTADKVLAVLGDCLREKSGRRSNPDKSQESAFRTELETHGIQDIVMAFIMFLDRPKGLSTLHDPWGHFLRELPDYLRDVDTELGKGYSVAEVLEELWFGLFQFSTPEQDRLLAGINGLIPAAPLAPVLVGENNA